MDWLTFTATMVKALAWPGFLAFVLLIFRRTLIASFPDLAARIRTAKWAGGEVTFAERLDTIAGKIVTASVPAQASSTDNKSPSEQISRSWSEFERWLAPKLTSQRIRVDTENIDTFIDGFLRGVSDKAHGANVSSGDLRNLVQDATLSPWRVTPDDAERFDRLISFVKTRIPSNAGASV